MDDDPLALRSLAIHHGLTPLRSRPPLGPYLRDLWGRRSFILAFSRAGLTAKYSGARLGQLWQIVTPLLNAGVFYLVFGVLLQTRHGIPDYIPFLVTGVFIWGYTQSSISAGTTAITGNEALVRALHFPRAALPLAVCAQQLQQLFFSLVVLGIVLLGFGVPPQLSWLLLVPALVLQTLFNVGVSALLARAGSRLPDLAQFVPFVLRTWMYFSGVMYSLQQKAEKAPELVQHLLNLNPTALYIDLARFALIDSFTGQHLPLHAWLVATAWALVAGVGGFVWFWAGEESYGQG